MWVPSSALTLQLVLLGMVTFVLALPEELGEPLSALTADDECSATGSKRGASGGQCALNALQQRLRPGAHARLHNTHAGHPFIKGCHTGTACPGSLECVVTADGTWSQCVNCSHLGFWDDCIMMDAKVRAVATVQCKQTCPYTTPKPITSGCKADEDCKSNERCATTADGTWSQCVDCSHQFYKDCQKLESPVRLAAILTCKRTCLSTQCSGKEWCHSPYHCVGNQTWAQCLKCDSRTFTHDCSHWTADYRAIAEHQCHRRCRR
mmetsp:Transcript_18501/g.43472  ORF Transcript_18501/g.43472 Transcript_18501/m.43472 type:complete len:264 (+) Transcript_18501:52-843(+)